MTADMTNSTMEVLTPTSFKLHNVDVNALEMGMVGKYSATFQFDFQRLVFAPVSYGPEPTTGKTWTITFPGVPGSFAEGTADILLTSDPVNRVIYEQITGKSGEISGMCVSMKVVQGRELVVQPYPPGSTVYAGTVANSTIYACDNFSCWSGGAGGGEITQGTPFPGWFDFNTPFALVCQVNGSNTVLSWALN